jgi:hypothetical protein
MPIFGYFLEIKINILLDTWILRDLFIQKMVLHYTFEQLAFKWLIVKEPVLYRICHFYIKIS